MAVPCYIGHPATRSIMRSSFCPCALLLLSCAVPANLLHAQNTVGLLQYDQAASFEGYTLIYPFQQGSAFLLNNCGQVVHDWPDTAFVPGVSIRLMNDGGIQRCAVGPNPVSSMFAGGAGQFVQRKDWDNTVTWMFPYCNNAVRMHHDACVLPNGNTLIVAWENKTIAEAWQAGRDTVGFGANALWPDHIVEVQPTGLNTGTIVWEWHAWDHLIQEFNPLANNFGVVTDNAQLIDINYDEAQNPDWLHINYVEYNPVLDQIVLSVPHFNELWVIDHSTTSAEAALHTGGNSGKGGDLLYRWGNPQAYRQGLPNDQKLTFNHGTSWVDKEALPGTPDFGRIIVFNNRQGNFNSSVDIIDPPVDVNGNYAYTQGTAYAPTSHSWRYTAPIPGDFFSSGLSNGQKLPNGNVLICSGRQGWIFEVDSVGTMVWEYENPIFNGTPVAQGFVPLPLGNQLFHAARFAADHPGLLGHNLNPIGYIELNPDTTFCNLPLAVEAPPMPSGSTLQCTLSGEQLLVTGMATGTAYSVFDTHGRLMLAERTRSINCAIDLRSFASGIYVLKVQAPIPQALKFMLQR